MDTITVLCFLLISITTAQCNPTHKRAIVNLYSSEDDVQILTADNFYEKIENSTTAWFVKYYLSWCGHCQRLSLIWKDLAQDIFQWKDLVQIGAIDCAEERNMEVCRNQNVTHYPVLMYHPIDYPGFEVEVPESKENVNSLRRYLLDTIIKEFENGRGGNFPNIAPYQHSGFGKLFDGVPNNIKYVILVMDRRGDYYLGAEVAMDLHKTPNVIIRNSYGSFLDPAVVAVDINKNLEQVVGNYSSRQELKENIVKFLEKKRLKIVEELPPPRTKKFRNQTNSDEKLRKHVKKMGDVVFLKDLETAVRHSLGQEVANSQTIENEKLEALRNYFQILKKYFPFSYKAGPFLAEITNITSLESFRGGEIAEIVRKSEENGIFSSEYGFLGCLGSSSRYRGYPCSLWKLFHYLTVNANNETNPEEVLTAMHGYVRYFFGCKYCSEHFQEMALMENMTEVSSLDESILWLWKAHNAVNFKLKGESTEDPEFPKEQFPNILDCPQCVNEDESWNEEEVLKYLKRVYGNENLRFLGSDTRILFEGLQ